MGETPRAPLEKKAQILKATLVFLDERGFSLRPPPCQTGAPRGQTPFLDPCFNGPKLSAISAVTPNPHAYLRRVRGTITRPQVIRFVRHRLRRIPGTIFLFGDGRNAHRSKKTRAALAEHPSRLRGYRRPAYAPELHPDEGLWAWMKQHARAGPCPPNLPVLEPSLRRALRRLPQRPQIIRSFFQRGPLAF